MILYVYYCLLLINSLSPGSFRLSFLGGQGCPPVLVVISSNPFLHLCWVHPHHQRPIGSTSSGQLSNCRSTKRSSPLQRQRRCVSHRNPIEIGVKSYKLGYWAMGSFSQNNCSTESMVVSDCDHMVKS